MMAIFGYWSYRNCSNKSRFEPRFSQKWPHVPNFYLEWMWLPTRLQLCGCGYQAGQNTSAGRGIQNGRNGYRPGRGQGYQNLGIKAIQSLEASGIVPFKSYKRLINSIIKLKGASYKNAPIAAIFWLVQRQIRRVAAAAAIVYCGSCIRTCRNRLIHLDFVYCGVFYCDVTPQ